MPKTRIERSEAILRKRRNTQKGLFMRNKILKLLYENESKKFSIREITNEVKSTYVIVNYHLKNMLLENVVLKENIGRKLFWQITGLGQQTIMKWFEENNNE